MTEPAEIILNSFLRKTENSSALRTHIRATGAQLTRKGRSRNWLLRADNQQLQLIIELIDNSGENSWLWLAKKLSQQRHPSTFDELLELVRDKPSISIKQLMSLTDCTITEARKALDQVEWAAIE